MLQEIASEPAFGITLTLFAYYLGLVFVKKTDIKALHPIILSFGLIVIFLSVTGIDIKSYHNGAKYITFLLGPATVALAIPLYHKLELLKRNLFLILSSTALGSIFGVVVIILLGTAVNTDSVLLASFVPKAATTPIAVGISEKLGGVSSLTILGTMINGLLGGMFGPPLHKILKIRTDMARGLSMGMAAHGIGTARAFDEDELQGALSTVAFSLMGVFTALTAPIIYSLLSGIL